MNQNSGQIFLRWGRPKGEKSPTLYGSIETPDGQKFDVALWPTAWDAQGQQKYPQPGFKGSVNYPRQQQGYQQQGYNQAPPQQNYNQAPPQYPVNQGVTHQRPQQTPQYPQQQNAFQQQQVSPPPQGNW